MATMRFTATETPAAIPLASGLKYLMQNTSTRYEIFVAEGATVDRLSPAYRVQPLAFLGLQHTGEDIWIWTTQTGATVRARLTFAERAQ